MNAPEKALVEMAEFLADSRVPYMVVGGMANAIWGGVRTTVDVDVTVWVEEAHIKSFVEELSRRFKVIPEKPLEFIKDTRVLPVRTGAGVVADVIFGILPFEWEAINRAVTRKVAGAEVKFCTAEDLILHKIVSEREQDILDVKQLIAIRKDELDREYLDPRVKELAMLLEKREILEIYENALE